MSGKLFINAGTMSSPTTERLAPVSKMAIPWPPETSPDDLLTKHSPNDLPFGSKVSGKWCSARLDARRWDKNLIAWNRVFSSMAKRQSTSSVLRDAMIGSFSKCPSLCLSLPLLLVFSSVMKSHANLDKPTTIVWEWQSCDDALLRDDFKDLANSSRVCSDGFSNVAAW